MVQFKSNPRILCAKWRVKHRDIFDMKALYKLLHEWIKEKDWIDFQDDSAVGDQHENLYLDKTGLHGDKELWIWWRVWNWPDIRHTNSFFRYHIDFDFHCVYMQDTEVMFRGKKVKTNKGEVELKTWAWIEMDYNGEWSKHPILRFFLEFFNLRIFYNDLLKHKVELYRESFRLQGIVKKFLQLKQFLPEQEVEPFHPSKGIPEGAY